jgi:hypothetical protein
MCPSVVVSRTLYLNLLLERYAISQFVDAEGIAIFQQSFRNGAMSWRGDDNFANWREFEIRENAKTRPSNPF